MHRLGFSACTSARLLFRVTAAAAPLFRSLHRSAPCSSGSAVSSTVRSVTLRVESVRGDPTQLRCAADPSLWRPRCAGIGSARSAWPMATTNATSQPESAAHVAASGLSRRPVNSTEGRIGPPALKAALHSAANASGGARGWLSFSDRWLHSALTWKEMLAYGSLQRCCRNCCSLIARPVEAVAVSSDTEPARRSEQPATRRMGSHRVSSLARLHGSGAQCLARDGHTPPQCSRPAATRTRHRR